MERRAFERIAASLPVKYYCDDRQYSGTIRNFSEKGMFITTGNFFPCVNSLEVHVPLKAEIAMLTARIQRIEKISESTYNIGIELLDPSESYVQYVEGRKTQIETGRRQGITA